jgi:hypothetical protein
MTEHGRLTARCGREPRSHNGSHERPCPSYSSKAVHILLFGRLGDALKQERKWSGRVTRASLRTPEQLGLSSTHSFLRLRPGFFFSRTCTHRDQTQNGVRSLRVHRNGRASRRAVDRARGARLGTRHARRRAHHGLLPRQGPGGRQVARRRCVGKRGAGYVGTSLVVPLGGFLSGVSTAFCARHGPDASILRRSGVGRHPYPYPYPPLPPDCRNTRGQANFGAFTFRVWTDGRTSRQA